MKKIASITLVFTLLFSLISCSASYGRFSVAEASAKREVSYTDYSQDGYGEFIDKLAAFSARLTDAWSERWYDGDENIVISPLSIYMALALAVECSQDETRDEILSAVGVSYEEVEGFTSYLYAFCNRDFKYYNPMGNQKVLAFEELSNSFWADDGISLNEAGVKKLADSYNCDLFKVNFTNGEARRAISSYIKDKTHGLCEGDVDFDPETIITLINTFYLKEVWNNDGDDLPMTDTYYDFVCADGEIEKTKLLRGYYFGGKAYEGEGYTAFYTTTDHNFSIRFILPDEGKSISDVFTAENIYTVTTLDNWGRIDHENKQIHSTRAFFPEYEADFNEDIKSVLRDMGIERLFDEERADLSGITAEPAYCSTVIHECSLEVTKKGIEGAAVTIMGLNGSAGPGVDEYEKVYHDFIVDRAFGFVITDSYGAVLFSGVINEI